MNRPLFVFDKYPQNIFDTGDILFRIAEYNLEDSLKVAQIRPGLLHYTDNYYYPNQWGEDRDLANQKIIEGWYQITDIRAWEMILNKELITEHFESAFEWIAMRKSRNHLFPILKKRLDETFYREDEWDLSIKKGLLDDYEGIKNYYQN